MITVPENIVSQCSSKSVQSDSSDLGIGIARFTSELINFEREDRLTVMQDPQPKLRPPTVSPCSRVMVGCVKGVCGRV